MTDLLEMTNLMAGDARRMITSLEDDAEMWVKHYASMAFSYGGEYLERMRVAHAPLNAIFQNRAAFAQRLAQTPRCKYRRVEVFTDPTTGEAQHSIGDPCGGKLVVKKLRREIVDVVCRACGRSGIPTEVAQQQEAA